MNSSSDSAQNSDSAVISDPKAASNYRHYVLSRISSRKVYPVSSRANGETGRVKLNVIIDTSGNLVKAEIIKPCEYEALNEAALNAVRKSAPFKKMKSGQTDLEFTFIMDFSLQ